MKLVITKNILKYNNQEYTIDDLYTKEFYDFSNSNVFKYKNDTYFANELFINFIQNSLAIEFFLKVNSINNIELESPSKEMVFYITDIAKRTNIEVNKTNTFYKIKQQILFHIQLIASFFYLLKLMVKIPFEKDLGLQKELTLVRTISSKGKAEKLGYSYHYESPFLKESVYKSFKRFERAKWLVISLISSYKQYNYLKNIMHKYLGENSKYLVQSFYGKRLVHTNLYKCLLENIIKVSKPVVLKTGNNLDRYAFVERELARKYNLKLICFPHGLEYGFKFPQGFTGDIFYTTSEFGAHYLNNLYETEKFVFDLDIVKTIFSKTNQEGVFNRESKVVFFTEPREPWVNFKIIRELLPKLKEYKITLCLKLHPKDIRNDYEPFGLEIIDDFDLAITNSICFSRKSTILLEALYNNSKSAAILLNNKDESIFFSFPSLQNDKIERCFSIEDLVNWIKSEYKKKEKK